MKKEAIKDGLHILTCADKTDLAEFLQGFDTKKIFSTTEPLPQDIAGDSGRVVLPCSLVTIDGIPKFSFVEFSSSYEGSDVMKGKAIPQVAIKLSYKGESYDCNASITKQEAELLAKVPNGTYNVLVRRADKAKTSKSGSEYYPHYLSFVKVGVKSEDKPTTENKQIEQTL